MRWSGRRGQVPILGMRGDQRHGGQEVRGLSRARARRRVHHLDQKVAGALHIHRCRRPTAQKERKLDCSKHFIGVIWCIFIFNASNLVLGTSSVNQDGCVLGEGRRKIYGRRRGQNKHFTPSNRKKNDWFIVKLMEWYFSQRNHSFSANLHNGDLSMVFSRNNDLSVLWNWFSLISCFVIHIWN